jgi:hypothetical protein
VTTRPQVDPGLFQMWRYPSSALVAVRGLCMRTMLARASTCDSLLVRPVECTNALHASTSCPRPLFREYPRLSTTSVGRTVVQHDLERSSSLVALRCKMTARRISSVKYRSQAVDPTITMSTYSLVPCLVPLHRNHIYMSAPDYACRPIKNVSADFLCSACYVYLML